MQTRSQQYADAAFKAVSERKKQTDAADYGRWALKLPIYIQKNGLCAALAFAQTKKESLPLLQDLQTVLEIPDLPAKARESDVSQYLDLTRQTQAALLWFKRFAQSELEATHDESNG